MKPCARAADLFSLATLTSAPDYGSKLPRLLADMGDASSVEVAADLFRRAIRLIGADAGVFMSATREATSRTSFRSLLACDPLWAIEYSRGNWHENDPWLRHATFNEEPIRSAELTPLAHEMEFVRKSADLGFASAVIVPAPSSVGSSRVGVLSIGSRDPLFFDDEGYRPARVLARSLAMELHRWLLKAIRAELLARSRLTDKEIELLRQEDAGLPSKVIAANLNIDASAVDRRFQRLCAKLAVPDRRTASRIARLYGLLNADRS